MNRRSFLGLGLKSVVLAAALTTGLGRTSLSLAADYRIEDLVASAIERVRGRMLDNVFSKTSVVMPGGRVGLLNAKY